MFRRVVLKRNVINRKHKKTAAKIAAAQKYYLKLYQIEILKMGISYDLILLFGGFGKALKPMLYSVNPKMSEYCSMVLLTGVPAP